MALSSEFVALVQQEIPEGRQSLQDSHANLEKVAAYCIENFARAENKVAALEETKNYTTQSLASVAYQINTLAYNFLQMIEQQTNQLGEMESQVNYISQMVMIHKEKVARREIGVLTSNKATTRQYKILAPANGEKPIKYVRKPIDFTRLDDIGHGLRSSNSSRSRRSASSVGSTGAQVSPHAQPTATAGPAPTTKPPTPPQANRSVSSLSRGSREYRTPPAVAPPQVPSNYAPNYPMGHPRRNEKGSGYSTLPHPSTAHSNTHNSGMGISAHQNSGMGISAHQNFQVGLTQPMQHPQQAVMQMPHGMMQAYLPPPQQDAVQYSSNIMGIPRGYLYDYTPQHQYRILRYPTVIRPAMTLPKHIIIRTKPNSNVIGQDLVETTIATPPGIVSDREFFNRSSGAASPPLPPPPPEEPQEQNYIPPVYEEKVIAVYDYAADKEDELTFSENAVIYVLKKNDDGWWEGVLNGVTGLFPGNYVEPLM